MRELEIKPVPQHLLFHKAGLAPHSGLLALATERRWGPPPAKKYDTQPVPFLPLALIITCPDLSCGWPKSGWALAWAPPDSAVGD